MRYSPSSPTSFSFPPPSVLPHDSAVEDFHTCYPVHNRTLLPYMLRSVDNHTPYSHDLPASSTSNPSPIRAPIHQYHIHHFYTPCAHSMLFDVFTSSLTLTPTPTDLLYLYLARRKSSGLYHDNIVGLKDHPEHLLVRHGREWRCHVIQRHII